jgi:uracil-DNA glycosylase family 4
MESFLTNKFGKENVCPFFGNQNAKIVHISQAPSLSVIKNNKPFTDKSGERLRNDWYKVSEEVFYNPNNFYFTAVGMYYPGKDKNGGDKKPSYKIANKWLKQELSFLDPEIYLIIGSTSAKFFFPNEKLTDLVFKDQIINNKQAFVLPHPSPINIKWFKDNPEFEENRIKNIRIKMHKVLELEEKDLI